MPPTKKKASTGLHPIEAIIDAFDACKNLSCVNLATADRVENVLSTGSLALDLRLGGGLQRGRICDIFGPEAAGKSTIIQEMVVSAQRYNVPVVHFDPEAGSDPRYMRRQGIDLRAVAKINKKKYPAYFYSQPDFGEDIYQHMIKSLNRMRDVDPKKPGPPTVLFLVDSLAAMTSEDWDDDEAVDKKVQPGIDARMHSRNMKQLKVKLRRKGALWVFTNQTRMKIGGYGSPEVEPGGQAVKYLPDYKIRMSASRKVEKDLTKLSRQHLYLRTVKNKLFLPFQEIELDLLLGRGLDKAQDAHVFLRDIGRLKVAGGRRRIMLKRFDTGAGMSWEQFRATTESEDFRGYCRAMLQSDPRVFKAFMKTTKQLNYEYDQPVEPVEEVDGQ